MDDLTFAILVWTACAVAAYFIAQSKRAPDATAWALWGLLLGPLGVLAALFIARPVRR